MYGSVCSGIEAATVAWHPLGWTPAFFSEIEAFPRAVLKHHYPLVPLHGDFTTIIRGDEYGSIDVLVGGTPCQDFSVAGLRAGIAGERGNLTLEFLRLAARLEPRWIVWENVPGVLSSDGGRALGAFLGGLAELGYGFAYRVLDAQHFGLAQRRARVFVVGYLGDWRRAAAVLFERESLQGHPAPRREAGQRVANSLVDRPDRGGGNSEGQRLISTYSIQAGAGRENPASGPNGVGVRSDGVAYTLEARAEVQAVAFAQNSRSEVRLIGGDGGNVGALAADAGAQQQNYIAGSAVRRLTPRECERLQGFPDDYTLVPYRGKPAADGPRYQALGNSMAVPVMRWIGERIAMVEQLTTVGAAQ